MVTGISTHAATAGLCINWGFVVFRAAVVLGGPSKRVNGVECLQVFGVVEKCRVVKLNKVGRGVTLWV